MKKIAVIASALIAGSAVACASILGIETRELDPGAGDGGPDAAPDTSPGNDAGSDASPGDTGSGGDVVLVDSAPSCDGGLQSCNGVCVDIGSSKDNCGACGHSCGPGACTLGVCQSFTVQAGITALHAYAVDSSGVYYTAQDKVFSCPVTGCKLAPVQVASMNGQDTDRIAVGGGNVYFVSSPVQVTTRPMVYMCPNTGCAATVPTIGGAPLSGVDMLGAIDTTVVYDNPDLGIQRVPCTADAGGCTAQTTIHKKPTCAAVYGASGIYLVDTSTDAGSPLVKCPDAPAACTAPTTILTGYACGTYAVGAGRVWFLTPGPSGFVPGGSIATCPDTGCTGAPTNVITKQPHPTELAVNAAAVYWINGDTSSIAKCPVSGCVGGAHDVQTALTSPTQLVLGNGFVYWVESGNTIRAVAEPL